MYPLVEKTSGENIEEKSEVEPLKAVDVNLWHLSGSSPRGKGTSIYKTCVVSTCSRVSTNWFSGRKLQPSIESVVANSFVSSDFLVDGQVSGLGTVHPFSLYASLAHGFFLFMLYFFPLLFSLQSPSAMELWMTGPGSG